MHHTCHSKTRFRSYRQVARPLVLGALISASASYAQSDLINLDDITLSTSLVANIVSIEDDIATTGERTALNPPAASDAGRAQATIAATTPTPSSTVAEGSEKHSGSIFSGVNTDDTTTVATTTESPEAKPGSLKQGSETSITAEPSRPGTTSSITIREPNIQTLPATTPTIADERSSTGTTTVFESVAKAESTAAPTAEHRAIDEDLLILNWATAWSNNDVTQYLSFYASDFDPTPEYADRAEWERVRRKRLQNQDINIIVSNADIFRQEGSRVDVRFTQRYTSAGYRDRVIKSIVFESKAGQSEGSQADGGKWKIVSERTLETLPFE